MPPSRSKNNPAPSIRNRFTATVARGPATASATPAVAAATPSGVEWTFLTNHAHVLLCLAREPEARIRDVAAMVGITERAVQRIVTDLKDGGYIEPIRSGRRNHYEIRPDAHLRHPIERHERVSSLLALVIGKKIPARS